MQKSSSQTYSGSGGVPASVDDSIDDASSSRKDWKGRLNDALCELVIKKKLNLEDLRVLEAHIGHSEMLAEIILRLEPKERLVVIRRELRIIQSGK